MSRHPRISSELAGSCCTLFVSLSSSPSSPSLDRSLFHIVSQHGCARALLPCTHTIYLLRYLTQHLAITFLFFVYVGRRSNSTCGRVLCVAYSRFVTVGYEATAVTVLFPLPCAITILFSVYNSCFPKKKKYNNMLLYYVSIE